VARAGLLAGAVARLADAAALPEGAAAAAENWDASNRGGRRLRRTVNPRSSSHSPLHGRFSGWRVPCAGRPD
jgi:hypothetical protein